SYCPPATKPHLFFSSRRRHTRSKRDWSSDVCSSDLKKFELDPKKRVLQTALLRVELELLELHQIEDLGRLGDLPLDHGVSLLTKIGRASCRERVWSLARDDRVYREGERTYTN